MKKNEVRVSIMDMETGEESSGEYYLFFEGRKLTMTAIVKITHVDSSYVDSDSTIMEVFVDCLGLDSFGNVFTLVLVFYPDSFIEGQKLLKDMKINSIFLINGNYNIIIEEDNPIIQLLDPSYKSVGPEFSKDEIRKAFRINSRGLTKNNSLN